MTNEQISDLTVKCRDLQLVVKELIEIVDPIHPEVVKYDNFVDNILNGYMSLFRTVRLATEHKDCSASLYNSAVDMFYTNMKLLKVFVEHNGRLRTSSCDKYLEEVK